MKEHFPQKIATWHNPNNYYPFSEDMCIKLEEDFGLDAQFFRLYSLDKITNSIEFDEELYAKALTEYTKYFGKPSLEQAKTILGICISLMYVENERKRQKSTKGYVKTIDELDRAFKSQINVELTTNLVASYLVDRALSYIYKYKTNDFRGISLAFLMLYEDLPEINSSKYEALANIFFGFYIEYGQQNLDTTVIKKHLQTARGVINNAKKRGACEKICFNRTNAYTLQAWVDHVPCKKCHSSLLDSNKSIFPKDLHMTAFEEQVELFYQNFHGVLLKQHIDYLLANKDQIIEMGRRKLVPDMHSCDMEYLAYNIVMALKEKGLRGNQQFKISDVLK